MKITFAALLVLISSTASFARDSYVRGYVRSDGTAVQGYHRTTPDNTVNNNYGTQGNYNVYNNTYGTRPRNEQQPQGQYNTGNGWGSVPTYNYGTGNNE